MALQHMHKSPQLGQETWVSRVGGWIAPLVRSTGVQLSRSHLPLLNQKVWWVQPVCHFHLHQFYNSCPSGQRLTGTICFCSVLWEWHYVMLFLGSILGGGDSPHSPPPRLSTQMFLPILRPLRMASFYNRERKLPLHPALIRSCVFQSLLCNVKADESKLSVHERAK